MYSELVKERGDKWMEGYEISSSSEEDEKVTAKKKEETPDDDEEEEFELDADELY